ncbi:MAG: hypothetical protein L0207_03130 [Chlamydiae bacterium]|nr:hypothetical protein [Chlamydiota bacterium]
MANSLGELSKLSNERIVQIFSYCLDTPHARKVSSAFKKLYDAAMEIRIREIQTTCEGPYYEKLKERLEQLFYENTPVTTREIWVRKIKIRPHYENLKDFF